MRSGWTGLEVSFDYSSLLIHSTGPFLWDGGEVHHCIMVAGVGAGRTIAQMTTPSGTLKKHWNWWGSRISYFFAGIQGLFLISYCQFLIHRHPDDDHHDHHHDDHHQDHHHYDHNHHHDDHHDLHLIVQEEDLLLVREEDFLLVHEEDLLLVQEEDSLLVQEEDLLLYKKKIFFLHKEKNFFL